jgi:hypothetical protein
VEIPRIRSDEQRIQAYVSLPAARPVFDTAVLGCPGVCELRIESRSKVFDSIHPDDVVYYFPPTFKHARSAIYGGVPIDGVISQESIAVADTPSQTRCASGWGWKKTT